mgnify:CR=1 FL=1
MKTENIENQDPDLEKIRHYRGTWKNFFDFWKKKGVEVDPYKGTILKYPTEKTYKGRKNVHQDFGTYDKAKKIQENMKPILSYDEFLAESVVNEESDQARLTYFRNLGIAPNNQPQKSAYIKAVAKPGKFFVDWKDTFGLGAVALEFVKQVTSISEFDIIDLKTMKRTGKQLDYR